MGDSIIKTKAFAFSLNIVKLYKSLTAEKEFVLSKQLLRSGTAIGALVCEAKHAESTADFIHKMAIAQKEANETNYWLELLYQSHYLEKDQFDIAERELREIIKMLASIIVTSKSKKPNFK